MYIKNRPRYSKEIYQLSSDQKLISRRETAGGGCVNPLHKNAKRVGQSEEERRKDAKTERRELMGGDHCEVVNKSLFMSIVNKNKKLISIPCSIEMLSRT